MLLFLVPGLVSLGSRHLLECVVSMAVAGRRGGDSSRTLRAISAPLRHVKDRRREHKRAHPVITLNCLSVNEINKEPVTFQENGQRSSSPTERWNLVGGEGVCAASAEVFYVRGLRLRAAVRG